MQRYIELQEQIQNAEAVIHAAEQEELSTLQRLQDSQNARVDVVTRLHEDCFSPESSPRLDLGNYSPNNGSGIDCSAAARLDRGRSIRRGGMSPPKFQSGQRRNCLQRHHNSSSNGSFPRAQSLGQITEERPEDEQFSFADNAPSPERHGQRAFTFVESVPPE